MVEVTVVAVAAVVVLVADVVVIGGTLVMFELEPIDPVRLINSETEGNCVMLMLVNLCVYVIWE